MQTIMHVRALPESEFFNSLVRGEFR